MISYIWFLFLSTVFVFKTSKCFRNYDDLKYLGGILIFLFFCWINVLLRSLFIQKLLHEIMVLFLLLGHLTPSCKGVKNISIYLSILIFFTRIIYNKCLFLWWNETRNIKLDLCHLLVVIFGNYVSISPKLVCFFSVFWSILDLFLFFDNNKLNNG